MVYKVKYDAEADVLTVVVAEKGKLAYAEEVGDIIGLSNYSKVKKLFNVNSIDIFTL